MAAPALTRFVQGQSVVSADMLNTFQQTCDNFDQLRDLTGVMGMQVFARGQTTPNDGYGSVFFWSDVANAPDDNATVLKPYGAGATGRWIAIATTLTYSSFLQRGAGAVPRTVLSKMREPISILDYGAIPDNSGSAAMMANSAAMAAAINDFASPADAGNGFGYYGMGGHILVPMVYGGGNYYMDGSVIVDRAVAIECECPVTGNSEGASRFVFPQDTTGFIIDDKISSPSGFSASGAALINVSMLGPGGAVGTTGYGIEIRTTCRLEQIAIDSFRSDGINIYGEAGVTGNCNGFHIEGGRVQSCGGHGLRVSGSDANAGLISALDCSSNAGIGFFDSSFLGNTYIECHTASNTTGSYKTDNINSRCLFLGCYAEGGQPLASFTNPTTVIGGIMDMDLTTAAFLFHDGRLAVGEGVVGAPSITCSFDKTTGFWLNNAGAMRFSASGAFRGNLGTYLKWASNGTFFALGGSYHEFVQDQAAQPISIAYATSSTYTGLGQRILVDTASGTGFNMITAYNAGGIAFQVLGNGAAQNVTGSFGAISDIKWKDHVVDAPSQWEDVKAIRLRKFHLKTDPAGVMQLGVVAQETQATSPGLIYEVADRDAEGLAIMLNKQGGVVPRDATGALVVSPEKEAELAPSMSLAAKYSILHLKAFGALQEGITRIEALEATVARLSALAASPPPPAPAP